MKSVLLSCCYIYIAVFCCAVSASSVFMIQTKKIGGVLDTRVLINTQTGEYCEIIVDYGGRVEDLVLMSHKQGKLRKTLLTHNGNVTAIKENMWWKGMILLPWANRIAKGKYTFYNDTYQLDINENSTNPVQVNALHGYLANKTLNVDKSDATDEMAALTLSYKFVGDEKGYPFKLTVSIQYTLSKDGLAISFSITNDMLSSPLPVYIGWHPYFACEAYKATITFDQCSTWGHIEMNDNFNPSGITSTFEGFDGRTPIGGTLLNPTYYDDGYKAFSSINKCSMFETRLHDPDDDQTVVLWQDSNFRFVQVFTGSASKFGENAVAIEPMSGMADSYNNHDHLSILSGGEEWNGAFGVYVN